ncbi:MAG TPA: sigma-70 family RNA polymerase sigma factor, partial [Polyangiaceae bacterium]|nr:sigma-70 family RNA polymerase sigma factor [Polyangiaceae bacterium]
ELERALEATVARARGAWPSIDLTPEAFVAALTRHLPAGPPREALGELRVEELWLTCAAAGGDARAVALIEAHYFGKARAALAGIRGGEAIVDEALQRLRAGLFVGPPPKIAAYGGRGDLGRWLRTAAMRTAMDLLGPRREVAASDAALGAFAHAADEPVVELMKREYGASFQAALREALAALPPELRSALRQHYLEGLGVERMGALAGVAASTVSRRLDKARRLLREATRTALAARLRVDDAELDSILRLVETRMDLGRSAVDASRVDGAGAAGGGPGDE